MKRHWEIPRTPWTVEARVDDAIVEIEEIGHQMTAGQYVEYCYLIKVYLDSVEEISKTGGRS